MSADALRASGWAFQTGVTDSVWDRYLRVVLGDMDVHAGDDGEARVAGAPHCS